MNKIANTHSFQWFIIAIITTLIVATVLLSCVSTKSTVPTNRHNTAQPQKCYGEWHK
jgi:hypothetical protein